jgi:hypothetical protein
MDEGRKHAILIAASILAARKLAQYEYKPCPATECAIADAIAAANKILARIDSLWPAPKSEGGS